MNYTREEIVGTFVHPLFCCATNMLPLEATSDLKVAFPIESIE
jgi:hypothetical protein